MELAMAPPFPTTSPGVRFSPGIGTPHLTAEDRLRVTEMGQ
jgi:hypothetical protein